ncbi:protein IQ-DOMAIN 31-like [Malania oleifera]|uniref:protein IQ-DOMAIN 31-like n=1 Tax=Malania oleifera TaxID=397392 RepID=UPI0025ADD410|nr:protein IQ-DOMAIN 31-like [Malania oleifera]
MGKSRGKWIKTILFGKKSSKSNFSKKTATKNEEFIAAKASSSDLAASSLVSDPALHTAERSRENEFAKGAVNLPQHVNPDEGTQGTAELGSPNNSDKAQQEQAITKVQAAYRGYLARRAFRTLKGIIRLQAVIRGHLVRRQAVATLYCMQGIIKFQALIRGRRIRFSDTGLEVHRRCSLEKPLDTKQVDSVGIIRSPLSEKLLANAFVIKLLASSTTPLPLHLQYDPFDSNSSWSWLDRWSSSHFWKSPAQPKKARDSKPRRKQANSRSIEMEQGRPKRGTRRASNVNSDNSLPSASEYEKPKYGLRKLSNLPSESMQENPQNELERVKRNLRKVSMCTTEANERSELIVNEKPKQILRKVSNSPAPDVSEQVNTVASEKTMDPTATVSKEPEMDVPLKLLAGDETVDGLHDDQPVVEECPSDNGGENGSLSVVNEELISMEGQTCKQSHRTRRRRSLPIKQEEMENHSQNNLSLPSYMAATASAKAKVRAQGSPRLGQDETENGFVRRHSLPSSTNGKLSSPSPRMHRTPQASGKGGPKSDRSLSSSRDGHEKATQAAWRR